MNRIFKAGFFQKIVLPAFLVILMFVILVVGVILPAFERSAMEQKQQMLEELTYTAWSILNKYHEDEKRGQLATGEAQEKAKNEIKALRYGQDGKDYFWITDLKPSMIMHPYVHELNGQSLEDFADPDGKKLFMEARDSAKARGQGFIRYKWQFMDDSSSVVPKLSFVRLFRPWGWIIGTGIYIDDVEREMKALTRQLVYLFLLITGLISLFIVFIAYQSLRIEDRRQLAEKLLLESKEKYRSLLESSTEGLILLSQDKISYSNQFIQSWLGYEPEDFAGMRPEELFFDSLPTSLDQISSDTRLDIRLRCRDGSPAEAVMAVLPVRFAGQEGLLLTFRDTQEHSGFQSKLGEIRKRIDALEDFTGVGLFRFPLMEKGRKVEFNEGLARLLGYPSEEMEALGLSDIMVQPGLVRQLMLELSRNGRVEPRPVRLRTRDHREIGVLLSLFLNGDSPEKVLCEGMIRAVGEAKDHEETDSGPLVLALAGNPEPALAIATRPLTCPSPTPIHEAIEIMARHHSSFILIQLEGLIGGIVTRGDLLRRFWLQEIDPANPISLIMTAPVEWLPDDSSIERVGAFLALKPFSHVLLVNSEGKPSGIIHRKSLSGRFFNSSELFSHAIGPASGAGEYFDLRNRLAPICLPLLREAGNAGLVNSILSKFNQVITGRIWDEVLRECGKPPLPFAIMTIGSAARNELAFNSDQDNALIYADPESGNHEEIRSWFLAFGERFCSRLNDSGLPNCDGGYMASNPKWCQPLSKWKELFQTWIEEAEPENLLKISVFFDLSHAGGDESLVDKLEEFVLGKLQGQTAFYYFLARNISGFKPPVGLFGNLLTDSGGKKADSLDIKNPLAQVVMFTRIYSLFHQVRKQNTIERIQRLGHLGVFSPATVAELSFHFSFLTHIRLREQARQLSEGQNPTNSIEPKKLSEMEQTILKKVFSQMTDYESRLSAAFMSAYKG